MNEKFLLEVEELQVVFPATRGGGMVRAVDRVSFRVPQGKTVGLVGESGSGKTTIGRTLVRLQPATAGSVRYAGEEILGKSEKEFRPYRKEIQMIFQDPYGSLNPRLTILDIIGEPLEIHFPKLSKPERKDRVGELLRDVGLDPGVMPRRPQEFSGGQRQRIGIARALAVEPKLIICDEPVSALDVSVQAQIVNLLQDLQEQRGLTYLFIAHDLAVVEHISDEILVMHHGKIVEAGTVEQVCQNPQHDYTKKLLASVPALG
jgi:oligopeptide transport system ATP-binding protein